MKMGDAGTRSVMVVLTVPEDWPSLNVTEVARKLRQNEPHLSRFLAKEIIRWGKRDEIDRERFQEFMDTIDPAP